MYSTRRTQCREFDRNQWERASPFQRALKLEVYVMRSTKYLEKYGCSESSFENCEREEQKEKEEEDL
jgi:hypothetical protein